VRRVRRSRNRVSCISSTAQRTKIRRKQWSFITIPDASSVHWTRIRKSGYVKCTVLLTVLRDPIFFDSKKTYVKLFLVQLSYNGLLIYALHICLCALYMLFQMSHIRLRINFNAESPRFALVKIKKFYFPLKCIFKFLEFS